MNVVTQPQWFLIREMSAENRKVLNLRPTTKEWLCVRELRTHLCHFVNWFLFYKDRLATPSQNSSAYYLNASIPSLPACGFSELLSPNSELLTTISKDNFRMVLISHGRVQRRFGLRPRSRLDLLRNLVTGLVQHERIEAPRAGVDEMHFYTEHLIDYAKRGDSDPKAMRMADFWLTAHTGHYTRTQQIPNRENLDRAKMAVIEYKGNPLPPLPLPHRDSEKTLVNQLLKGYREDVLSAREAQQGPPMGTAV
ncbi:large ribosomal subunit protein bL17m-like [Elgaria multicarinata webbii]|uniref:large ribosomal subunit protein bL17m-like n=1 Tax=Elgaria multicarinata webbii TaxID=159646 RepID=UPI002FCD5644